MTVEADRISVALNNSDILNVLTGQIILLVFLTKLSFIVFIVRSFFLLSHFLVVEDYELSKSTIHIPIVPLNLECTRILTWSISFFLFFFFYFNCLPDDVLCYLSSWYCSQLIMWQTIWRVAASWDSLWVVIWYLSKLEH